MKGRFNGQIGEGSRRMVGPVPQRELVRLLSALVDASRARSGSRTRDEARAALRALLDNAHWNTPYVRRNIGLRRRKFISRLGYFIPYDELRLDEGDREQLERLNG